ncbi:hypothetical protein HELRODRAFT_162380 [Helobdella robusta]|uniref:Uncharacterized protein n=1 Tax=Helobdella robusta TaxID=6412 RepID=T1ESL0_HELRO|nr:hypothetical protein HELRODRAFT_162380 [Helobdella robusta]ESN98912.1 hypothetical protein HELRODRAFT_162380 [Helobdella robusta]
MSDRGLSNKNSVHRSSWNFENRWVLRSALNFASDGEVVREVGKEFQKKGPDKAKADLAKECLTRVTTGMELNENLLPIKCTCHSDLTSRSNSQTATPLWKMQKMRRNVLKSDGSGIESDSSYSDSGRGLSEDERFKQINRNKISSISLMTPMNGLCKVSTADVLAVHEVLCANNNRHLKNQNVQVPSNAFVHQDPNDLQQANEKNRFHRTLLNRINEKQDAVVSRQDAVVSRQDAVVSRPSPSRLDSTERKSHSPSNDGTIRRNWSVAASEF